MLRVSWATVVISTVSSALGAAVVCTALLEHSKKQSLPIVRTKGVELVDDSGRVRAMFELRSEGGAKSVPWLAMRDTAGKDAIDMFLDQRGDGDLAFSNDYWPEGAIILGHIQTVDDGTESKSKSTQDPSAFWGLRVRSPDSHFVYTGFVNKPPRLQAPPPMR